MKLFGMLTALAVVTLCATSAIRAEEFQALSGGADAPLHTNRFNRPESRSHSGSLFGTVRYVPWKNSCVRVPPVVAGQALVVPRVSYSLVAPYIPHPEPQQSFVAILLQSLVAPAPPPASK